MGLLPMLTVGKRELGQCITDLAVWHVMSGMGEWAKRRRGYKDFAPTELVTGQFAVSSFRSR
jgi:hypothetical protein